MHVVVGTKVRGPKAGIGSGYRAVRRAHLLKPHKEINAVNAEHHFAQVVL